jgi:CHAT domain-containing protein
MEISGRDAATGIAIAGLFLGTACGRSAADSRRRAVAALRDGQNAEALRLARDTERACGHDRSCRSSARILQAEVFLRQGDRLAAAPILAEPFPEVEHSPEAEARLLTLQAVLSFDKTPDKALATFHRGQELARLAGDTDALLDSQYWEGRSLLQARELEQAEKIQLAMREAALRAGDCYHDAVAANLLGMTRFNAGRYEDAIGWFQQALNAGQHGGGRFQTAAASLNMGMSYARLGVFDRAFPLLQAALDLIGDGGTATVRLNALGELGTAYLLAGDPQKAAGYYRRAAALATADDDLARWRGNQATALIDLNDWEGAEQSNEQARAHATSPEQRALAIERAGAIAAGRGRYQDAIAHYQEAVDLASDKAPTAAWEAHAGLVEAYTGAGDHARAMREFSRTREYIDANMARIVSDNYKLTFFARLIAFYQDYVRALVDRKEYDTALQIADSSRARILYQRLALDPANAPAARTYTKIAAARGSALLFYWVAPERSYLWVVTRDRVNPPIELPAASQIEKWVDEYDAHINRSLADPMTKRSEAGKQLYEALIAPAARLIPHGSNVIVVPDGPLHWLNLETLPVYDDGKPRYVAEDYRLVIAPSLGVLAEGRPARPAAAPSLLVIGDPVSPAPEFPALSYAAREIENIRRSIPRAQIERGAGATPDAYRQAAGFSLLHFSAHAVANQQNPLESAIVLSRGGGGDFKLYAKDVMPVRLRADLVTLSACQSAGSRSYSGEGLVGFAWAFLQSGARNVIAGLWDVTDSSTPQIMDMLYAGLAKGESPADALRAAKESMIHSDEGFRRPYYWGPFQVYTR